MMSRLLAQFSDAHHLLLAARQTRQATAFRVLDAYTPFSVEGLAEELDQPPRPSVKTAMLIGGVVGGLLGLALQWVSVTEVLPIQAGGRALASWPDFFFAVFELTVLGAALAGFVSLLVSCGLPRLHHPLFAVEGFERASQDRFFLEVEATETAAARAYLKGLGALRVEEVPA